MRSTTQQPASAAAVLPATSATSSAAAVLSAAPATGLLPAGAHGGGEAALHHSPVGRVAFASNGYYCGYYYTYYTTTYSCSAGYAAVWPDVNLDVDIWVRPTLGITIGANVMWGTYTPSGVFGVPNNSISSTTWEPHVIFSSGYRPTNR